MYVYRFSSNVPFLELDYPLSGAIDIGILHSLYNQAPKKVILYEKQYTSEDRLDGILQIRRFPPYYGQRAAAA
jgi:hypothetical protein